MKKTIFIKIPLLLAVIISCYGCTSFLEVKPDVNLATPETLEDFRALLDDESKINRMYPGLIEMGTDDFFVNYDIWASRTVFDQDIYLWKAEPLYQVINSGQNWSNPYLNVAIANVVLEGLTRTGLASTDEGKRIRGEALFIRALYFFYLVQLYAPVYEEGIKNSSPGIPLKLSSSANDQTVRATLGETYARIIGDFTEASELLPHSTEYLTRATVLSANAALSKVYLAMGNYEQALLHAEKVLETGPKLMDYNNLDLSNRNPFPLSGNTEILYFATSASASTLIASTRANVDTLLYDSYSENDLRKQAFFNPKGGKLYSFKGFYSGSEVSYFAGLAIDEVYLNKAECLVRSGRIDEGLEALNDLMVTRWKNGEYTPYDTSDKTEALTVVLQERRKELIRRGTRWADLKRLNLEASSAVTLTRKLGPDGNIQTYTLEPNDLRYVYLIPQNVIEYTKIPQNKR